MKTPGVFVALDGLNRNEAVTLTVAEQLATVSGNFGFKFNDDYVMRRNLKGASDALARFNRPRFADLKMWKGSRTMAEVVREVVDLGVDFVNVYALAEKEIEAAAKIADGSNTTLLGLTVLSHYNDAYCRIHFGTTMERAIWTQAHAAEKFGCKGLILPGTYLEVVKNIDLLKVVTAVRPDWFADKRHEQVITPRLAVDNGGDILVVGSPIMKSADPPGALAMILAEIA